MDISGIGGAAGARVLDAAEKLGKKVRILGCEDLSGRERRIIRRSKILFLDAESREKALEAAKAAKEHGVTVFLTEHGGADPGLTGLADILIRAGGDKALPEMASMGRTVLTVDSRGCRAFIDGHIEFFPAYPAKTEDTSGEEAAFCGAFLAGYLDGMKLRDDIRFASAFAALYTEKGRTPTKEEALSFAESMEKEMYRS